MRPTREKSENPHAAYFVTTQTARRQPFFRHERWATLLREIILHYTGTGYSLHAWVIMPDHLHMLLVPTETLEKAVQLIKGGFSFRAKREFTWNSDIWQPGFTDRRIRDEAEWKNHLNYIRMNPVHAHLVSDSCLYPYMDFPASAFPQGLKPPSSPHTSDVRAEARTLQADSFPSQVESHSFQTEARSISSTSNEVSQ
jgi:putative transposase